MIKRNVLVCAAALMTGCYSFFSSSSAEFREQEAYLERTQPERFAEMRAKKNDGMALQVLGGLLAGIGCINIFAGIMTPASDEPPPIDEDVVPVLLSAGGLLWLVGFGIECTYDPYVRREGRRREGRLLIGPNGCALACRF